VNRVETDTDTTRTPLAWAQAACETVMEVYTPIELPPAGRWHYHQGVFLCGMEMAADALAGERERYQAYIQSYVDGLIDESGNFLFARDELDALQAGLLLFDLDARTSASAGAGAGMGKYRVAADKLRALLPTLNRTREGGFWHKDKYPHQMWLDGLYMGGVFALKYDRAYGDAALRETVLLQERLMRKQMSDARTGLLYHAWDESRTAPWADMDSGCSPEFWGRSLGWYGLALAQFLDVLDGGGGKVDDKSNGRAAANEEAIRDLERQLGRFAEALVRYQDPASGLWYQVVNKGERPDNWLETSGSCLFVYTLAKAVKRGLVDETCREAARLGYQGLIARLEEDSARRLVLPDICVGTSAGDYAHYVARPTSRNDLHGIGAFVMACVEMDALLR